MSTYNRGMFHGSLRLATAEDLGAINDIYNYYVTRSTCTYQLEPETAEGRAAWFAAHGPRYPVTVATDAAGVVVGWGSLSRFRERAAYDRTVENGVYVHAAHHRRGVGRAVLLDLVERATALGYHTIVAGIDAEQAGSVALHAACGFERTAHMREVGFKFGRWLDVIFMQRWVGRERAGASPNDEIQMTNGGALGHRPSGGGERARHE